MKFTLCLLLLIIVSLFSEARDKQFSLHWLTTEEGLSSNIVLDMARDSSGFVWIGTPNGINRFDGLNVKQYTQDPSDSYSFPGKALALHYDKWNNLWVGTETGLLRYDPIKDNFRNYTADSLNNAVERSNVNSFIPDLEGNVWVYQRLVNKIHFLDTRNQVISFSFDKEKIKNKRGLELTPFDLTLQPLFVDGSNNLWIRYGSAILILSYHEDEDQWEIIKEINSGSAPGSNPKELMISGEIGEIFCDEQKNAFIITEESLYKFYWKGGKLISEESAFWEKVRSDNSENISEVTHIESDKFGRTWLSTATMGILIYDHRNQQITRLNQNNGLISNLVHKTETDASGNMWIYNGNNYLFYYDVSNDILTPILPESMGRMRRFYSFHAEARQIFKDEQGIHWFNTRNGGICFFNHNRTRFESFYPEPHLQNQLTPIWGLYEDKSHNLWIGLSEILLYNRKRDKTLNLSRNRNQHSSIENSTVTSILETGRDSFLVGTVGLQLFRLQNNKLEHIREYVPQPGNLQSLPGWSIRYLFRDRRGDIWVGTNNGISRIENPEQQNLNFRFQNFFHDVEATSFLDQAAVWHIYEDHADRLWVSTRNRLYMIDSDRIGYTEMTPFKKNIDGGFLPKCVLEYPENTFWIATEGQGLVKWDIEKDQVKSFRREQGMPSDQVFSVLNDANGYLWLSTRAGLVRLDPENETMNIFTESDGIIDRHFTVGAFHKSKHSERLFFGSSFGVNAIDPSHVHINKTPPRVFLSGLKVRGNPVRVGEKINDKVLLKRNIPYQEEVKISHFNNDFSVIASVLNFDNPEGNSLRYKLEGYHQQWQQQLGSEISFSNLPRGRYNLKVYGISADGISSVQAARLKIIVRPPWWKSYWAFASYLIILGSLMIIFLKIYKAGLEYRKRIEIEHIKYKEQIRLKEMTTRFFMNISHDLRTPLTLILGPVDRLLKQQSFSRQEIQSHLGVVENNAKRLLALINQLLDLRRMDTGFMKLNVGQGDIFEFIKKVYHSFDYLAREQNISYELKFENKVNGETSESAQKAFFDADKLEKILYNLIYNAFKFTPRQGNINISAALYEKPGIDNNHLRTILYLEVKDTGVGIPEESIDLVFDRFQISTSGFHQKSKGTGIGLSLTRDLTRLHKGTITVQSAKHKGSAFLVELPVNREAYSREELDADNNDNFEISPHQPRKVIAPASKSGDNNLPLLLVVDDNPEILDLLRSICQENYKVIEAENGIQGLEMTLQHMPDVIICDVMMPEMDGISMTKKLKTDEKTCHIPVVLLTARESEKVKISGLKAGALDYITKPFKAEDLLLRLNNLTGIARALSTRFRDNIETRAHEVATNNRDVDFLQKLENIILENIDNTEFGRDDLVSEAGMSYTVLYKKVKALTGLSINLYIRRIKLLYARDLLQQGKGSVKEIADLAGFKTAVYFTQCFKEHFKAPPSGYLPK